MTVATATVVPPEVLRKLPSELSLRIGDAGYNPVTWADVQYQCESGIMIIDEGQDWYSSTERRQFRPQFVHWLKKAKAAQS